ncbi:hypothetical protein CFBP2533_21120 [Xanthomonas hortorum pv. pelargonii]|uniref:Uncharacterized protein n=1 Tax=Xanthomonas hortorum pv. pelargonii TaxID=453602 RepID=A0A6V7D9Y9_9XANT|nr:hypothetical protein CFBP2533_21120 [Xanthomonas hortorum pv. pelargonii]CAD0329814.1 hypothetical protein CFBP2533_21120 [Xanthomonas hortorum pv. pelargonii]
MHRLHHAHRSSRLVLARPPSRDLTRHGCRVRAYTDVLAACPAMVGGQGPCSQRPCKPTALQANGPASQGRCSQAADQPLCSLHMHSFQASEDNRELTALKWLTKRREHGAPGRGRRTQNWHVRVVHAASSNSGARLMATKYSVSRAKAARPTRLPTPQPAAAARTNSPVALRSPGRLKTSVAPHFPPLRQPRACADVRRCATPRW